MNWGLFAGLFFILMVCSYGLTALVTMYLRRRALLDVPNERSSHTQPTPRGGGLAVVLVILAGLGISSALGLIAPSIALKLSGVTVFLAVVSWLDDVRNLGALSRFGSHVVAVILALALTLVEGPFFGGVVPPTLEIILISLGWVWFVNLFNFMDGIDGLAATETIAIGLGCILVNLSVEFNLLLVTVCTIMIASASGFLRFNWNPAKVFLGDVGSIPIGFLCGWALLDLASQGYGVAAIILSLVFLADATLTLFKRLFRGEKIWQAHRQHFYQQAVQRGMTHSCATLAASITNAGLIGLAIWSTSQNEIIAFAGASLLVTGLFVFYLKFPVSPQGEDIQA